jgi:hypothetical protein
MFEAIKALADSGAMHMSDIVDNLTDDMVSEFCANEIASLDNKAAKAKERAATKKAEGDEMLEAVYAALTEEFESIATITEKVDAEDATVHKVQYRLKVLIDTARAEKQEISVSGSDGKGRKIMGYRKLV